MSSYFAGKIESFRSEEISKNVYGNKSKTQVAPDHYFNKSYDTKERFISYWRQINEIIKLGPNRVLEIGIGNGFVILKRGK